jgi:hypothetical protein
MTTHDDAARAVRHRALANLVLALRDLGRRTAGRLRVRPLARDAVLLEYRDVRTLIRRRDGFAIEPRDVTVALACPPRWPLERAAALVPCVLAPDDFAGPNTDGRLFCLDLAGVLPERIPELLYDNLRLRRMRLDHCVDPLAAAFVRARLAELPCDPRPLLPERSGDDAGHTVATPGADASGPAREEPR